MHYKDIDKISGIQGYYVKVFRKYRKCIIIHIKTALTICFLHEIKKTL